VSIATAAAGAEPHRVTKSQRFINISCGSSSETVGDLVLLGRSKPLAPLDLGMRLGRPILSPNGERIPVDVTARAHSHIVVKEAGLRLVRGSSRLVEWDMCRKQLVTIILEVKRLDLLPDHVAEESVAGPATEQHDSSVHWYTVGEVHCHGRQRAKGVDQCALG